MRSNTEHKFYLPHMGQRIIKTAAAVFICLLIYRLLGYEGDSMPSEAAITAIICMQPFISDSRTFALNRFTGTLVGAVWGSLFLLLLYVFPVLGRNFILLYALMAAGVLISLYTTVALKATGISSLSAIVFICIVICFPDIEAPHVEVAKRFMGVLIGTVTAIAVNHAHLPRSKRTDLLFFVRAKDLTPNRFSQIPPNILFYLNRLYEDGAKICLMLEHAPALFTMQMSSCQLSVPLIVMDGAAIFDANQNRYIYVETLEQDDALWLQGRLRAEGIGFFTYIIRNHRTCIFHDGTLNEQELQILKKLQRSPYRSYLDGDDFCTNEIVYLKIIDAEEILSRLKEKLDPQLDAHGLRSVIRDQVSTPGISGLYIYSKKADPVHAKALLMELLKTKYPDLQAVDMFSGNDEYSDHEAVKLLHRLTNAYEPVKFIHRKSRNK